MKRTVEDWITFGRELDGAGLSGPEIVRALVAQVEGQLGRALTAEQLEGYAERFRELAAELEQLGRERAALPSTLPPPPKH